MPKKRTDGLQKMTIAQQQEVIDRFKNRSDVRAANDRLATLVLSWVIDAPLTTEQFLKLFHTAGHEGQYHEKPSTTTGNRVIPQAGQLPNITKRLSDTPLDYMGALELSFVYERIMAMMEEIAVKSGRTMTEAIALYKIIGEAIRIRVFTETGHYPEEFPAPSGIMTGEEESSQFKLTDHQPPLF